MLFLGFSYASPMPSLCSKTTSPMLCLCSLYAPHILSLSSSNTPPNVSPRRPARSPMSLGLLHTFPMPFLCFSYAFPMLFLCFSSAFPMLFLCFSYAHSRGRVLAQPPRACLRPFLSGVVSPLALRIAPRRGVAARRRKHRWKARATARRMRRTACAGDANSQRRAKGDNREGGGQAYLGCAMTRSDSQCK